VVAGNGATRTLLAIVRGAVTYDEICAETGLNRSTTHRHLLLLWSEGLVDWEEGKKATLHPTVRVVG